MTKTKNISVLLCDDHQIIIDGLTLILNGIDQIKCVSAVHNGQEALDWLENNSVDIVLMDINMPVLDGIKAAKQISKLHQDVKVIFLSMMNQLEILQVLVDSGAKGFLFKNSGKKEVENAIFKVFNGETYFDNKLLEIKEKLNGPTPFATLPKITKREKEILTLVIEEYTSPEIAEKLSISLGTVETHRRNLISKLAVKNTAGLVRVAMEYKLV